MSSVNLKFTIEGFEDKIIELEHRIGNDFEVDLQALKDKLDAWIRAFHPDTRDVNDDDGTGKTDEAS